MPAGFPPALTPYSTPDAPVRRRPRFGPLAVLAGLALLAAGCDEKDAAGLKVTVAKDGSGTLFATGLFIPAAPRAVEAATTGGGSAWKSRAAIAVSRGSFTTIGALTIGGITFQTPTGALEPALDTGGAATMPHLIKITLPRGKAAAWPALFAGANEEERAAARAVLADDAAADLGKTIKFTLAVPGRVIGSAVSARGRKLIADRSDDTATLVIPVELAVQEGEPLIWHVSWEEK
ncbi:hypothetical protein BH11PLA1_BH11PLA1_10230 [soil metagenome]